MKNTKFTPLSEQEMITVNGGGPLDGIPVVGGLLGGLLSSVTGLVTGLPVVGGLLGGVLTTVQGLLGSLLGGLNLPI